MACDFSSLHQYEVIGISPVNPYRKALEKFLDKFNFDVDIVSETQHIFYKEVLIRFLQRENNEPVMFKMIEGDIELGMWRN